LPHEWSDDAERYSEREYEEIPDERESREIPDEIEKAAQEAAEEFDRQQEIERMADVAAMEFDEWESKQKEIEDLAEAAAKEFDELQREQDGTTESLEDNLRNDIDEVRDELHDEYVNDMSRQLEGVSQKDSEVKEGSDDGTAQEAAETSESYEDAGTGMVYAMETKSETEEEMQEVSEPGSQDPSEQEPESEDVEESLAEKHTNRIVRHESEESEATTHSDAQEVNEPTTSGPSPEVTETEEDKELPEVNKGHSESEPAVSRIEQREYEENVSSIEEGREHSERSELEEKEDEQIEDGIFETVEPVETSAESEELVQDPEESPELCDVREPDPLQNEGSEAEEEPVEKGDSEHETSEDPEVEAEVAQESVEEETLPEGLDDFVERVRELLDERIEEDDDYDYVQDPLTGEIQRVPKILGEYETDEQRQRRKNRNLFAELSGEERERFKQLVRERAENDDERTVAAVERAWNQVIERAERKHNELRERVGQVLENPEVKQLLESMSKEDEESRTSVEHAKVDDEVDEEGSLGQFLPRSYDEFIEALQRLSTLKKRKNVEREIEHVRIYYESKEELQRTDFSNISKRQLWKYLSQKYGISDNTLRNWFAIGNLPRLLRIVRDEQAKAAGFNLHKPYAPITISIPESYDAFLEMLERHPYLRNVKGFNRMLRDVQEYYRLRNMVQRLPGSSYSELSRQVNVPVNTARQWIPERTKPELLRRLLKNERLRRKMESDLKAALSMMVDPSTVYNTLQPLRAKKNQTLQQIADALLKLISDRNPITIVRLKPYNSRHGPRWLLDIAKKIQSNREKLERILNERHNKPSEEREIRLGLVHNTLYIWNRNTSPWDYLNLFSKERFFFKKRFQSRLIQKTRSHLGMKGNYNLSELIRQLTGYDKEVEGRIVPNLRPESSNLRGAVLQLVLQIQNKTAKEIEDSIEKIGIGRQITNPRILNEKELKELLARLFAIISSDGSIEPEHRVSYYEKNKARQTRVKKLLQSFGEVAIHPLGDGFTNGFRVPNIIGRILSKVGVPVGDKVLQGVRLPDFILNGSPEVQLAYLQELIPEEGWVLVTPKDNLGLAWSRSVILYDANKSNQYKTEQKLTKDLVEFIERMGTKKERTYDSGVHEVYFILNMSDLKELMKSSNPKVSAKAEELDMIVRRFSSSHIEDERHIAGLNGIMTSEQTPGEIRRSLSSDRVSAKWQVKTANERDAILWGVIATPNDRKKKKRVTDWMRRHPAKVKKVQDRLLHSQREISRFSEKKE
jgi:hypothetical protein